MSEENTKGRFLALLDDLIQAVEVDPRQVTWMRLLVTADVVREYSNEEDTGLVVALMYLHQSIAGDVSLGPQGAWRDLVRPQSLCE